MKTAQVFGLFLIIAFALLGFQGCEETPTGPQLGSGTLLKGTIDGQSYTFSIDNAEYDPSFTHGTFTGSTNVEPIQSVTVSFTYDIDNGPFPKTLTGGDVNIVVVTNSVGGGTPKSYVCPVLTSDCVVTIKATDGSIVDGTFSGTLENTQNPNDKVTVTNGEFSAKLPRS